MGTVSEQDQHNKGVPVTTHHPLSTAAKAVARAVRSHEANPSAETAKDMLSALRDAQDELNRTESGILPEASRYVGPREMARQLGYASHNSILRRLANLDETQE